jgi:predicted dehydrogenase
VRAFCSFGKYHDIEVEDEVTAYAEYENGATGIFIATTGEAPGTKSLEIACDRGKVVLEDGNLTFWRTAVPVSQFLRESEGGFDKPETWTCEIPVKGGEEHKGITKDWVRAIREGTPLLAQGTEGINGVELANAMLLSAWTDDWVELPIDDEKYYEMLQQKIAGSTARKKETTGKVTDLSGTY